MPVPRRDHAGKEGPDHVVNTLEVHIDHAAKLIGGHFPQRCVGIDGRRIVDQQVRGTIALRRGGGESFHGSRVGDVAGLKEEVVPDFTGERLERSCIRATSAHGPAIGSEADGHCTTQTPGHTGDDNVFHGNH